MKEVIRNLSEPVDNAYHQLKGKVRREKNKRYTDLNDKIIKEKIAHDIEKSNKSKK